MSVKASIFIIIRNSKLYLKVIVTTYRLIKIERFKKGYIIFRLMLEHIVKKFVPFVGTYESVGFDTKGRVSLPKPLVETLKRRQMIQSKSGIELFYKTNIQEDTKCLEVSDYLPMDADIDFRRYRLAKIDDNSRILVAERDLSRLGFNSSQIVFVGSGNNILVYKTQDYQEIQPTL